MSTKPPIALTIAGSDPSGGAGIQADLKTFTALGIYGASVIVALTAQNTLGVEGVMAVPPEFIALEIDTVATDLAITATKTGMLGDAATVAAVCDGLDRHRLGRLVVDPVMVATSGDVLLAANAIDLVRRRLIPKADLVTPNLAEAARLLDAPEASTVREMEQQAARLLEFGPKAVLVKGGHLEGEEAIDVLVTRHAPADPVRLTSPRIATRNTHGTGCTLSAAITANLALGLGLNDAVTAAKHYLSCALASGSGLSIGRGHGPVDHLYGLRRAAGETSGCSD